ncbi:MAG: hypothetical protein ACI84C_001047 [Flavobacteriales bacterium]|jgi:hypothetical protein
MRRFEVDNEQEPLTDEQISKYKDYGKVVSSYEQTLHDIHRKPLYKNPLAFLALLVFLLIFYLVLKSAETSEPLEREGNEIEKAESINENGTL